LGSAPKKAASKHVGEINPGSRFWCSKQNLRGLQFSYIVFQKLFLQIHKKIFQTQHAEEGEMALADIPDLGTNNGVKFFNDA